jgi:hypothetical protein
MSTLSTYAQNIQNYQLAGLLPISDRKPELISKERTLFLHWLEDMTMRGVKFSSQQDAWETYKLYSDFDLFEEMEESMSWSDELVSIFEESVRAGNYDENKGQL